MFKTQKTFKILFALLIIISIVIPVFSAQAQESTSASAGKRTITNYQIPCASGTTSNLTTTHDGGSLSRYAYDWRCNINDKSVRDVYAPHAGVVKLARVYSAPTRGMVFIYDKENDACAVLLHLESSFSVKVGDSVTTSTKVGKYTYGDGHVHMAVFPGQCTSYNHSSELPIIFNEIGNVPSQKITLSNSPSYIAKKNLPAATTKNFVNGSSKLTITNDAVNLKVLADNLNGKTVYWQMWRPATNGYGEKEWNGQVKASGNSVSFTNLDGAGPVFDKVTYYTVASLNPIPAGQAKQQRTSCAVASGQKLFCDAVSLRGSIVLPPPPPTQPPSSAFVNGSSSLTITPDAVNLKVSADNLNGKTVYWQMWRPATNGYGEKEWNGQVKTSGNSVSFTNLDGAGPVFDKVTYYTVASLNPIPAGQAKQQRTSCAVASGQKLFCDTVSLGISIVLPTPPPPPTQLPSSAFTNGLSALTITADSVNLKVSADNLNGKMVYGQMWRAAANGYAEKVWDFKNVATSNSISFNDIDGAGPVFEDVTYYTVLSLSPISVGQAKLQQTSCAAATGQEQFCDKVTYSGLAVSTCTPGKSVDDAFMRAVISNLNTQTEYTIANIEFATQAMRIWQRYEGTTACWNPLATTWGRPGATNFNSIGVKSYITIEDGTAATANTIGTKNTAASYSAIRQMLALKVFDEVGIAANLKQYSGGGGYVTNVMNEWRTLFNRYRGSNTGTTGEEHLIVPFATLSCPATAEIGTSIDCTLSINPNNTAISGLQINLADFESILKHTNTQFSEITGNDPINLSTSGKIVWAGSNGNLISAQGTLATLSFDVLQAGTVNIAGSASAVDASNTAVAMNFSGATVIVQEEIPVTPAPTPDPVETPEPPAGTEEGTFSGKANLSAGTDPSSIALTLVSSEGDEIANAMVNNDGSYSLSAPAGNYILKVNASGYLRAEKEITIIANQDLDAGSVTLLAGDINSDDKIDPSDLISFGAAYESSPLTLALADWNKDGVINLFDLTLFAKNYRQTGTIGW